MFGGTFDDMSMNLGLKNLEKKTSSDWWFGTCCIFYHIWNSNPNSLSYFSKGWKPPTRQFLLEMNYPVVGRERFGAFGVLIFPISWGAKELVGVSHPSNSYWILMQIDGD